LPLTGTGFEATKEELVPQRIWRLRSAIILKTRTRSDLLFSIKLVNRKNQRSIASRFYDPLRIEEQSSLGGKSSPCWKCRIQIDSEGRTNSKVIAGADWLQAVLLAVEYFRQHIPINEEQDWLNTDGVPSWILLPKVVPYSWGYPLYHSLAEHVRSEEISFILKIDARRKTSKVHRGKS
jgi:hypothetical protein